MNSSNGLQGKVLWMVGGLFFLLVLGMIVFAFIRYSELNQSSSPEINPISERNN